jgi:hypothetical protein
MLRQVPSVDCGELVVVVVVVGGILLFIQYWWSTQWQWVEMGQEAEGERVSTKAPAAGRRGRVRHYCLSAAASLQLNRGPERENCET